MRLLQKIINRLQYAGGWIYGWCWCHWLMWFRHMSHDEAADYIEKTVEGWQKL